MDIRHELIKHYRMIEGVYKLSNKGFERFKFIKPMKESNVSIVAKFMGDMSNVGVGYDSNGNIFVDINQLKRINRFDSISMINIESSEKIDLGSLLDIVIKRCDLMLFVFDGKKT